MGEQELRESTVSVPTRDGPMGVFIATGRGAPRPAVILFSEGFGVNEHMHDMARRMAARGFLAALPDFYHRLPVSAVSYDEVDLGVSLAGQLDDGQILEDVSACQRRLAGMEGFSGHTGLLGFCIGGRSAFLAATRGRGFEAAVVCYGTRIAGNGGAPSLLPYAADACCPIFGLFGELDEMTPPDEVQSIAAALQASPLPHRIEVYKGAGHAFLNDSRPDDLYVPAVAEQAWPEVVAFLTAHLASPL